MSRATGRYLNRQQAAAPTGASLQRGTVAAWDSTDGYVVLVNGSNLSDVLVLASAGTLEPGDQVAVLRQKASVLILGKITAPS